ncbi:MAG TPA: hypothetical protein VJZ01_05115 [Lachnospiraceae bacterium]|nr:hypothetical protein [Lachnospiraceae bacterium]
MKKVCSIVLFVCLFCFGCATKQIIGDSTRIDMYVMIYDYENNGLQNVSVYINNELVGRTDIYGRYLLALKEGKDYTIRIKKNDYEVMEKEFTFDPMYVMYFQIGNAAQILHLAEEAMDDASYEDVLVLVDRVLKLDNSRIDALYLKSIAYYKLNQHDEALDVLKKLVPLVKNGDTIYDLEKHLQTTSTVSH